MQIASYFIAGLLALGGLTFLIASSQGHTLPRVIIGLVLLAGAAFMVYLARMKTPETKIIQEIELSGDVHAEQMKCQQCGAPLEKKSISVRAGGIFVDCPYCGAHYQLEEEPKW